MDDKLITIEIKKTLKSIIHKGRFIVNKNNLYNKIMNNNDLNNLREDLIGELQAINQYQDHIDKSDDEEVKKVLSHIRDDEKEHFAELTKIIRKLDLTQEEKFQKEEL